MKCNGVDLTRGEEVEISFHQAIEGVDSLLVSRDSETYVAPGWIDLQVNGFGGVDYNSPESSIEEIDSSIRAIFATGVTRFFPTVITGSPERMLGSLRKLAKAREQLPEGTAMEAFHIEGPFISPEDGPRGAHPAEWVRPPDLNEFRRLQEAAEGNIRLVTLAPEWPGAAAFIERVTSEGVVVSIGHTAASSRQIAAAVQAGVSLSTHLGNGTHAMLPKHSNYIWDQLAEDRLASSFILDGVHLPPSFVKTAFRAKGLERSILVTDAVMPAGCSPGLYRLGEVPVELHADGSVRLLGSKRLAGSALLMPQAIVNAMHMAGLNLRDAVSLATRNPARVGRVPHRFRGLNTGERADLVRFRLNQEGSIEVVETWFNGRKVFQKN